jgi:GDPmannose 4,6-dehydratase
MTMKTALITGVTGQDGSYIAELLLEKGYKVVGMKRRTSLLATDRIDHLLENPNFKLVYGSMNDAGSFYRLFNENHFDEIYNLAAQSHVRVSFDVPEETVDAVAMGPLRLLECIRTMQPDARFYQASSSEMFGDNPVYPQSESTLLMPASPYACAKVFAHGLVRNYREGYKIHASSGILFNHESPRRGETFVTRKITRAAARIKLGLQSELVLGNLNAKRDWGYAKDYVEAMWLMLQQDNPDDYVIATGETYSVEEFLNETFSLAGLDVKKHLRIDERLFRPHEVPHLEGDMSKASRVLGWKPKTSFKDLVKLMYEADFENECLKLGRKPFVEHLVF